MPPRKKSNISEEIRDATTQTDTDRLSILYGLQQCTSNATTAGHDQELSGTQLARTRLLMSSIRTLSSSKNKSVNEHKQAVSTLRDTNHRVRLMRGDYDEIFFRNRDDIGTLVASFKQLNTDTGQRLTKQSELLEEEKRKTKNLQAIFKKQFDGFQAKLKLAEDELAIKTTENEELKRKIIVAEQKVAMAKESEEDYRKKLDDKLFLASNQKCSSCTASEKIRSVLTSDIATKDRLVGQIRADYNQLQDQFESQKRVNQLLSKEAEQARFNAKTWQSEYEKVLKELKAFKASKGVIEPPPTVITPPDSEKLKDDMIPDIVDTPSSSDSHSNHQLGLNRKETTNRQITGRLQHPSNLTVNKSQTNSQGTSLDESGAKRLGPASSKPSPIKRIKLNKTENSQEKNLSNTSVASNQTQRSNVKDTHQMDPLQRHEPSMFFPPTSNKQGAHIQLPPTRSSFFHQDNRRPSIPSPTITATRMMKPSNAVSLPPPPKIPPPPKVFNSSATQRVPPPIDRSKIPPPPAPPSMNRTNPSFMNESSPLPHTLVRPSKPLPWHNNGRGDHQTEQQVSWMFRNS